MPFSPPHPWTSRAAALGGLLMVGSLFLAAVMWNRPQVIVRDTTGGVFVVLADGDCQSRMQRAALVAGNPGTLVKFQTFENHPDGIVSHATAPMDYLIAGLAGATGSLDLAGAWASPFVGLLTVMFLWFWAWRIDIRPRWPSLLLFCISPAVTHAFGLGRPDHQSLILAFTVTALAAGMAFVRTGAAGWAWLAGALWGLALWVSWFEPLVLLVAQEIALGLVLRGAAWPAARRRALVLTFVMAAAFWALEGFRNPWPEPVVRELFVRWSALLGELQPAPPQALFAWTGWLLVPAPLLLIWNWLRNRDPLAMTSLVLLVVVTALTGWQARWSPWLAAVFCLALPWVLGPLRWRWAVWTAFVISLWPVAREWEARLVPSPAEQARREANITEALLVAETAAFLRELPPGGVLAPWWISPALARLAGHPTVGGTSHQSLPGTADTARFFLAENDAQAAEILRRREVRYVVSDDPERIIATSLALLGTDHPASPMAPKLARGRDVPAYLELVFANAFFRVYKVNDARL